MSKHTYMEKSSEIISQRVGKKKTIMSVTRRTQKNATSRPFR